MLFIERNLNSKRNTVQLYTVKWLQILLTQSFICTHLSGFKYCNSTLIIQHDSFVCSQLNGFMYCYIVKLVTIVEGDLKAPFSRATTPRCKGGCYSFPWLLYFTLDPYLIMLSVNQKGIKYHFLSLLYDSTWDWTQVSRIIGEHSNYYANVQLNSNNSIKHHSFVWTLLNG